MTQAVLAVYAEELAADPSNYGIYLARADEYYRHSEYIKALDDVTKVLQLAPEKDEDVRLRSYILRAGIYNETHRPQEALNDLKEAIKIAPDSYSVVYQKANTDYTLGNLADAKTGFIKLERLNARTAEPYIGQARIAVKENNLGLANELLEKAVGVDPSNAEIYVRRASVRKQMGDHNGAVGDFILALSCDSKKRTRNKRTARIRQHKLSGHNGRPHKRHFHSPRSGHVQIHPCRGSPGPFPLSGCYKRLSGNSR